MISLNTEGQYYHHPAMGFDKFISKLRRQVELRGADVNLFTTSTEGIWDAYLYSFPTHQERQFHNCRCCRRFLEKFGGLVQLNNRGDSIPYLWDTSVDYGEFNQIVQQMNRLVKTRKVTGIFVSDTVTIGRAWEGGWSHFSVNLPLKLVNGDKLRNAEQVSAAKREDYRMLSRALGKYNLRTIKSALSLAMSGKINRPEVIQGMAEWFLALKNGKSTTQAKWVAVANAPVGYCNISSSALGAMLDDLINGLPEHVIIQRHNAKVDPLQYRRPQSAPGAQNIKRGEEIIERLGYSESLGRRYAHLEDLDLLWQPHAAKSLQRVSTGVFENVIAKGKTESVTEVRGATKVMTFAKFQRTKVMTFAKFQRTILPTAERLFYDVPGSAVYSALVTAVNPRSPSLFKWDNQVNWYIYPNGSTSRNWNLVPSSRVEVTGITLQPDQWNGRESSFGNGAHFILEDCKDKGAPGLALFPETLVSELHEVRKTIEAFSSGKSPEGKEYATACGVKLTDKSPVTIAVQSNGIITKYKLDRMD